MVVSGCNVALGVAAEGDEFFLEPLHRALKAELIVRADDNVQLPAKLGSQRGPIIAQVSRDIVMQFPILFDVRIDYAGLAIEQLRRRAIGASGAENRIERIVLLFFPPRTVDERSQRNSI